MKPKQKQRFLTREELDRLMGTTFDTPNRNFTRDMFLFSVFTGICYCDMRNLTEKNVVRDHEGNLWIETRRQKTGTPENVHEEVQGGGTRREAISHADKGKHEHSPKKDGRTMRHRS